MQNADKVIFLKNGFSRPKIEKNPMFLNWEKLTNVIYRTHIET